jgi:hypothetical protein
MRLSGPRFALSVSLLPAALLGPLLASPRARAAETDAPTVVLGLEALAGAPENVAAEITDALRQRVAAAKGFQLLQGKDLVEVKLVFACPDEAPVCMSAAGKSLGASKLIFGNVKMVGDLYQVTIKMLDVNRAVVDSFTADTIPKKRADPSGLRAMAPGWMAKLTGKGGGVIQVRSNLAGAAVSLDGTHVGTTGSSPVVITDVAPGQHEVSVEKSGYTTTKQEFMLAAGQSLPLNLTVSPVSVEVPRPSETQPAPAIEESGSDLRESHTLSRAGFWVAVAGTVAAAATAGWFGYDILQINKQLDPYRRIPCNTAPSGYCDGTGKPVDPSALTLSQADLQTVHDKTDQGNKDHVLQWVFVGLGATFALAGGVLLYKGYLASEGSQQTASNHPSNHGLNHGLRIFPTASASAGGIIAEFDF